MNKYSSENNKVETKNDNEVNLAASTFTFHQFSEQIGEVRLHCQFIKMKDSLYVWIGDMKDPLMDDLSLALVSSYENQPVATKLLGPVAEYTSINIAKRLSKKTGKPIYVSFNLPADNITLPRIEKRIQEEFSKNTQLLSF